MAPEHTAVEHQLEAIFASEEFAAAPKMRSLLRYLVDATQAGDAERLKGYAIGVDVFERGVAFDPGTDPIVRVQAGRLRKLLETYYLTTGKDDPIRIEIPKGGYAVEFVAGGATAEIDREASSLLSANVPAHGGAPWSSAFRHSSALAGLALVLLWLGFLGLGYLNQRSAQNPPDPAEADAMEISLAVLPFTNMSGSSKTHFTDGLTDALTTALARVKSVRLASRTSAFQFREATDLRRVGKELGVRYVLEGGLQQVGDRVRINVQLIDAVTGAHVWAQNYDRVADDELSVQSELVTTLAAELRPQLFGAAKRTMSRMPVESATAWQLYIQSTWVPGEARNSLAWEKERVALASRALEMDPNLGEADSVLADKLAYLANVDPPSDTDEVWARAGEHARRALDLAPADADVAFNVSVHHWHAGHIKDSLAGTLRTLDLDPNHVLARFLAKAVAFTCSTAPQAVIDELTDFDTRLSADNPVRWVTLTWISLLYLNNGDFERAADFSRRSSQVFRTPDTAYRLAAILVQIGDVKAAVEILKQQRETWPNLDPRHYADVAIPRRCGSAPQAEFLHRVYVDLANAYEKAQGANP
jgi:TolB-like protein